MAKFSLYACIPVDEQAAKKLLAKWVDLLGLRDWEIVFHWKEDPRRMAVERAAGCTSYNEVCRQAVIEIADPELYEREIDLDGFAYDYEETLVHELMHLKLSLLDDTKDKTQNRVVHILVDDLARALVRAWRYAETEGAAG